MVRALLALSGCFLLSLANYALAQPSGSYVFSESELTDNLSQVTATEIFQDSSGFIWILTQEGLNRYDGATNLIFRSDFSDPLSLSSDNVRGVAEDADGGLWFGTMQHGLNHFNSLDQTFRVVKTSEDLERSPLSDRIRTLDTGRDHRLWVGYEDGGFSTFDTRSLVFRHFSRDRYPLLTNAPVTRVLELEDGVVLVATLGSGVFRLDMSSGEITRFAGISGAVYGLRSNNVLSIYRDNSDNFWIGTSNAGLYRIDTAGKLRHYQELVEPVSGETVDLVDIRDVLESSDSKLFLATGYGIAAFDDARENVFAIAVRGQSYGAARMASIIEDASGLLWAGGYSGVFTGFRTSIETLNSENGLPNDTILSISRVSGGGVLVGTPSGLHQIRAEGDPVLPRFEGSVVTSLLTEKSALWIGTSQMGLYRVDTETGGVLHFMPDATNSGSISNNQITTIYKDSRGNLWVGTYAGGLNLMAAGTNDFQVFSHKPSDVRSVSNDSIIAIYQEKSGDLWVGTENGLNRFNYETRTFDRFMHDPDKPGTLSSRVVFAIHEDARARLWIGTQGGGLNLWEPLDRKRSLNRFSYFQSNIGLPSSSVYAIQGDNFGNIWLATSGGLTRYNHNRGEARNFTVDDGLQSNDFNLGASFRDAEGKLYFGGTSGLNIFDPAEIETEVSPPRIALTRVSLGNEQVWFDVPYSELNTIELEPDDYLLGFSFATLDYRAPHRNRYRYQMVGLDRSWVELGNRNTLDFTQLPMGDYVLRVQGANPDGVWSPEGIVLNIVVKPPFYLTWYAYVTYCLVVLVMVALFFYRQRLRAMEQLRIQAQLEDEVRARTRDLSRSNEKLQEAVEEMGIARREAEQANQAKSEFLAALSHEIRTPMHGVLGMTDLLLHSELNERQQNFAESAHVSANELLGLIDNILDFSKIEAGKLELEETSFNLRELVENLCYLYGELAQTKNLELNLVFLADWRRQVYGDPVRLRQILQNLLSNAIKFTKRGAVNLVVSEVSRSGKSIGVEFLVEDTGIGMDEATVERVFEAFSQADSSTTRQFGGTGLGLSIAKQLIDLMEGRLQVNSRPGVGTTMSVRLAFQESPIYIDPIPADGTEGIIAEIVAPVPETRAMFRSQLEVLGVKVHECSTVEELAPVGEQKRLVLVDVSSLFNSAGIALVENVAQDELTEVLLITPLSGEGVPPELSHLPHTTKPVRLNSLLADIRAAEAHQPAAERSGAPLQRFSQRVLLVEDIPANQAIARAMLESFGCTVAIAGNGEVAVDMFQQGGFDLVLMDCQMPVMDGFEATRVIRQYEAGRSGAPHTPVVALTAGKTETEKERCFAAGMDRILFKPYSTNELNGLLARYFTPSGVIEPSRKAAASRKQEQDLLDLKALDNIRAIQGPAGSDLLAAVFENFKQDGQQKLDELRRHTDDAVALGAGAHALKSMSLNLGAKALSDYCRVCETRWKAGNIHEAPREVELLAGHFRDAARALEQLLASDGETVD